MENILFYGEKDEASRRQVRSAAAQHSHRIGPRKAKASRRPRADSGEGRRRNQHRTTAIAAAPIAPGSAGKLTPVNAPSLGRTDLQQRPLSTSHGALPLASVTGVSPPATYGTGPHITKQENEQEGTAERAQWDHIQPYPYPSALAPDRLAQQASRFPATSSSQASALPPIRIARIDTNKHDERASTHTRSSSQNSSRSPTTRLPQYSWTEYPRYGLGQSVMGSSLQMLAHVATDRQRTVSPPTTALGLSRTLEHEIPRPASQHSHPGDPFLAAHRSPYQPTAPIPDPIRYQDPPRSAFMAAAERPAEDKPRADGASSRPDSSSAKPQLQPG